MVRRILTMMVAAGAILTFAGPADAGVTGPAFYVDGTLYRTVGTPTDFSNTGAPAHSYESSMSSSGSSSMWPRRPPAIPASAAVGGWFTACRSPTTTPPPPLTTAASGDLDSDEEVQAALMSGDAADVGVVKQFECPVIPVPRRR